MPAQTALTEHREPDTERFHKLPAVDLPAQEQRMIALARSVTANYAGDHPDIDVMARVLDGLQRLGTSDTTITMAASTHWPSAEPKP